MTVRGERALPVAESISESCTRTALSTAFAIDLSGASQSVRRLGVAADHDGTGIPSLDGAHVPTSGGAQCSSASPGAKKCTSG